MVITVSPPWHLRTDARFPRGAGQAKKRQPAASGDLSLPFPPALPRHPRSPSTPLYSAASFPPRPSSSHPYPPIALSSCRCRSFRPLFSRSPLTPRPTRYASHLVVPPRRASPRHPLSPCGRPPAFPPAGPRKRGIASNSNYRTRGYHASNLTLGCPMCDRASRARRRRFFAPSERPERQASEYGNVDRFFENAVSAMRRGEKERRVSSFFFRAALPPKIVVAGAVKPTEREIGRSPTGEIFRRQLFSERTTVDQEKPDASHRCYRCARNVLINEIKARRPNTRAWLFRDRVVLGATEQRAIT